jgi:hypothetical protein
MNDRVQSFFPNERLFPEPSLSIGEYHSGIVHWSPVGIHAHLAPKASMRSEAGNRR